MKNFHCFVLVSSLLIWSKAAESQTLEPRPLFVEAYTSQLSYAPGDEVALCVSTTAAKYNVEISRVGAKREVVLTKKDVEGKEHPVPENCSSHGCSWPASFKFKIPADWKSGYYAVALSAEDRGGQFVQRGRRTAGSEAFFVLRAAEPGKSSKILMQLCTNTYNAYNNWGGHSLYGFHARAKLQGHRVSFDRPPSSQFNNWEQPFVAWCEANGFPLEYAVNSDL